MSATKTTITSVLRQPHVARTITASIVARLAFGAMTLLIVLRGTEIGYSYGQAGLAAAAFTVGLGVGGPLLSRLIDRTGQTTVLVASALLGGGAIAGIGLLPETSTLLLYAAVALAAGASYPPLFGAMRALWDDLVNRDEERHIGYSLEAISIEVVFTGAPLVLVGLIAAAADARAALLTAATATCLGTLWFATSPPSRRWRPSSGRAAEAEDANARRAGGALGSPGVRTLMLASFGAGMSFGAIEIGVTAAGRADGREALIGILLATWSTASLLAGFAIARAGAARHPARRLTLLLSYWAITGGLLGAVASSPALLGAVLALAGCAIAPTFTTSNGAMSHAAPAGRLTEAFAWTMTALMAGVTLSAPLAGALVDAYGPAAGLSFGGVGPLLAAAAVWLRRSTLRRG